MKRVASAGIEQRMLRAIALGDEPADCAPYQEYVRGFDEIPVLDDAVVVPSRPPTPPNFVRGERRNLRKQDRPDGYEQREANRAELESLYQEYLEPKPVGRKRKTASARKPSRRKNRRPKRAAG